jgi:hypothetical protein
MVELIIKLPSLSVLDKLLPLLQQLKLSYQTRTIEPINIDLSKKEAIIARIKKGEFNIPNFEATMADFEASRQDAPLYGRD